MSSSVSALSLTVVSVALLTGCAANTGGAQGADPFEEANRKVHAFNTGLDRAVVDPVATVYGTVVPDGVRKGVSNVSQNVGMPGTIANDLLQARFQDAGYNLFRMTVNTTIGVGGLLDVAGAFGLPERDTDFGETLHVWGAGEGAYLVLPVLGPSTTRDAVGTLVDVALDPLDVLAGDDVVAARAALRVGELADTRYTYSDLYESVLYDSADSYAVMKLTYLDQRRYALSGGGAAENTAAQNSVNYDVYEDFYE